MANPINFARAGKPPLLLDPADIGMIAHHPEAAPVREYISFILQSQRDRGDPVERFVNEHDMKNVLPFDEWPGLIEAAGTPLLPFTAKEETKCLRSVFLKAAGFYYLTARDPANDHVSLTIGGNGYDSGFSSSQKESDHFTLAEKDALIETLKKYHRNLVRWGSSLINPAAIKIAAANTLWFGATDTQRLKTGIEGNNKTPRRQKSLLAQTLADAAPHLHLIHAAPDFIVADPDAIDEVVLRRGRKPDLYPAVTLIMKPSFGFGACAQREYFTKTFAAAAQAREVYDGLLAKGVRPCTNAAFKAARRLGGRAQPTP